MNTHIKTKTIEERVVHSMLATLCVAAVVYCVILLTLVFSVIERKQNILALRDTSSHLNTLETKYAAIVSSINDASLVSNNFVRIDEGAAFAIRKDDIASYTVLYAR